MLQYLTGTLKGDALCELQHYKEAIAAYDDLIGRFSNSKDPVIRYGVARALITKGHTLSDFLQHEEAANVVGDKSVHVLESLQDIKVQQDIAWALYNKGVFLA